MKGLDFLDRVETKAYDNVDLPVYVIESQSDWDNFHGNFGHKYIPQLLAMVKEGMKEDLLKVPVFKVLFINTAISVTAICSRDNFDKALQYCINYFIETEEYEKCTEAQNIIEHE